MGNDKQRHDDERPLPGADWAILAVLVSVFALFLLAVVIPTLT